ncbi:MAG: STAS domain-containing protein [Magnetococcales bacterium]|nr:STAS domain-containing protein [Magnetococcales bacterium]
MTIATDVQGREVTIRVSGKFNFALHKKFREAYRHNLPGDIYRIDMARVDYIDSSALGMLLLLREHAGGDGAHVSITNCNPSVKKILEVAGFQKLFPIIPYEDAPTDPPSDLTPNGQI